VSWLFDLIGDVLMHFLDRYRNDARPVRTRQPRTDRQANTFWSIVVVLLLVAIGVAGWFLLT